MAFGAASTYHVLGQRWVEGWKHGTCGSRDCSGSVATVVSLAGRGVRGCPGGKLGLCQQLVFGLRAVLGAFEGSRPLWLPCILGTNGGMDGVTDVGWLFRGF